ncbi:hypothetical protein ABID47_004835 [Paenibacillus favisporus]|uniref:Uncharacterized protein n=1 Tax=Paenibacillus favisporus TaxID=221028 RepID=A0ABV2F8V0_9BACL
MQRSVFLFPARSVWQVTVFNRFTMRHAYPPLSFNNPPIGTELSMGR